MKELEEEFDGRGEVKGWNFKQIYKSPYAYMYELRDKETGFKHYEVFERKENNYYNCVSYPTSKGFGVWAWAFTDRQSATDKYDELSLTITLN